MNLVAALPLNRACFKRAKRTVQHGAMSCPARTSNDGLLRVSCEKYADATVMLDLCDPISGAGTIKKNGSRDVPMYEPGRSQQCETGHDKWEWGWLRGEEL